MSQFLKKTYITILNNRVSKYIHQKLIVKKREIDKFINILENFNTPFDIFARKVGKST